MQGLYKFIRVSQILCSLDMNRSEQPRETKGSKIRRLKMNNFGRPLIARLCFTITLIHKETVLEMEIGSSKRQQLSPLKGSLWKAGAGQPTFQA